MYFCATGTPLGLQPTSNEIHDNHHHHLLAGTHQEIESRRKKKENDSTFQHRQHLRYRHPPVDVNEPLATAPTFASIRTTRTPPTPPLDIFDWSQYSSAWSTNQSPTSPRIRLALSTDLLQRPSIGGQDGENDLSDERYAKNKNHAACVREVHHCSPLQMPCREKEHDEVLPSCSDPVTFTVANCGVGKTEPAYNDETICTPKTSPALADINSHNHYVVSPSCSYTGNTSAPDAYRRSPTLCEARTMTDGSLRPSQSRKKPGLSCARPRTASTYRPFPKVHHVHRSSDPHCVTNSPQLPDQARLENRLGTENLPCAKVHQAQGARVGIFKAWLQKAIDQTRWRPCKASDSHQCY